MLGRLDDSALFPDKLLIVAIAHAELPVDLVAATTDHNLATSQAYVLLVYTCKPNDFAGIDGPDVVVVPMPPG